MCIQLKYVACILFNKTLGIKEVVSKNCKGYSSYRPFSRVGHLDIETRLITHEIQDGGQHVSDACCA